MLWQETRDHIITEGASARRRMHGRQPTAASAGIDALVAGLTAMQGFGGKHEQPAAINRRSAVNAGIEALVAGLTAMQDFGDTGEQRSGTVCRPAARQWGPRPRSDFGRWYDGFRSFANGC